MAAYPIRAMQRAEQEMQRRTVSIAAHGLISSQQIPTDSNLQELPLGHDEIIRFCNYSGARAFSRHVEDSDGASP